MSKKRKRQLPNRFSKTRPKRPIPTHTDTGSISPTKPAGDEPQKPNILFIMVDQMRFPRFSYGSDHGLVDPMKQILGFQGDADEENEFKRFFPGFWGLRDNAVVLNNHHTASSACVPSRAVMMTGQYGTVTGVKYTDGTLKDGLDDEFPWLDGKKFATLGDWMREAGYSTHYFGKWHCTGEETTDLEDHGFADWNMSHPDPYGGSPNNLGYFRDYQCSALTRSFLLCQGIGVPYDQQMSADNVAEANGEDVESSTPEANPWFAVCSFNNPHDIGVYPYVPVNVCDQLIDESAPYALAVPWPGTRSELPDAGTMKIVLNKLGIPQDNAQLPPTWDEDLSSKPPAQFNAAYKVGLSLMAQSGLSAATAAAENGADKDEQLKLAVNMTLNADALGVPLALTSNPDLAGRAFMQYYGYLQSEVDQHIDTVLKALDETGQADNTIIIFTADHGEYGGAHHKMIEKWHTAYEECIHVPMIVRFPRSLYEVPGKLQQLDTVSSHIDLLPTILGLANIDADTREAIYKSLTGSHPSTRQPIGADLSNTLRGQADAPFDPVTKGPREAVLYMTHDTISDKGPWDDGTSGPDEPLTAYEVFNAAIDELIRRGKDPADPTPEEAGDLSRGAVPSPSLVHSVISQDGWKLVRYLSDADNIGKNNHYELYDLNKDGNEVSNLLVFDGAFPTVTDSIPQGQMDADSIAAKATELMALLEKLEAGML